MTLLEKYNLKSGDKITINLDGGMICKRKISGIILVIPDRPHEFYVLSNRTSQDGSPLANHLKRGFKYSWRCSNKFDPSIADKLKINSKKYNPITVLIKSILYDKI